MINDNDFIYETFKPDPLNPYLVGVKVTHIQTGISIECRGSSEYKCRNWCKEEIIKKLNGIHS